MTRPRPGNRSRPLFVVAPLVFRAPSGPAAREIATREPAARSGRSRSPPVPSGPSGALHTGGAWSTDVWFGASPRSPDRPRHRPRAQRQIPLAPSTPAAFGVLTYGSVRWVEARPGLAAAHGRRGRARRPQVPKSGPASGGTPVARVPSRRRWGFCSIRNWLAACRRRVGSLMTPFPPFGDGEITV